MFDGMHTDEDVDSRAKAVPSAPISPPLAFSDDGEDGGPAGCDYVDNEFIPSSQYGEQKVCEVGDPVPSEDVNPVATSHVEVAKKSGGVGMSEQIGDQHSADVSISGVPVKVVSSDLSCSVAVDSVVHVSAPVLPVVEEPGGQPTLEAEVEAEVQNPSSGCNVPPVTVENLVPPVTAVDDEVGKAVQHSAKDDTVSESPLDGNVNVESSEDPVTSSQDIGKDL